MMTGNDNNIVTIPCTCSIPKVVNLAKNSDNKPKHNHHDNKELLWNNLKTFGWSPLVIPICNQDDDNDNDNDNDNNNNHNDNNKFAVRVPKNCILPTKQRIESLFTKSSKENESSIFQQVESKNNTNIFGADDNNNNNIIYRGAHSESGANTTTEPKESLEITLKTANKLIMNKKKGNKNDESNNTATTNDDNNSVINICAQWCRLLHSIAVLVEDLLELPPNVLLQRENSNNDKGTNSNSCMDLLRVFYYHQDANEAIGSSQHTDWGSWTIVWQDHVGGLETYCRSCNVWNPVPPPPPPPPAAVSSNTVQENNQEQTLEDKVQQNYLSCIVHVGDMTSLTMTTSTATNNNNGKDNNNATSTLLQSSKVVSWPSPKHRVTCSSTCTRGSLVYFAYPPNNKSLHDVSQQLLLSNNNKSLSLNNANDCGSFSLPLNEYYILSNQSTGTDQEEKQQSPRQKLESIWKQSVQLVIENKWKQVQRGY